MEYEKHNNVNDTIYSIEYLYRILFFSISKRLYLKDTKKDYKNTILIFTNTIGSFIISTNI